MYNGIAVLKIGFLLCWCISMYCFLRYSFKKIDLLKQLGLLNINKKKEKNFKVFIQKTILRWAEEFIPLGIRFTMFAEQDDIERRLSLAGLQDKLKYNSFLGLRALLTFIALLLGIILTLIGFGTITQVVLITLGFFGLHFWVNVTAKNRQEQIGICLPDFLDAMSVTLQAGTPLQPALKHVIGSIEGPLSEEMNRFLQEIELGVPREEAFTRLMERNNCPELETLVLSLIQGSKLGVPIAQTFKVMAEDIREARIGKIKEKAAKAAPKVTLITTFIILPAVILCIMGLMVLNFIYNPEGMGISGVNFM